MCLSCSGTVSHCMEPNPGCVWQSRYLQTRCGVVQDEWLKRLSACTAESDGVEYGSPIAGAGAEYYGISGKTGS